MIEAKETAIPLSPADKVESEEGFDLDIEDEWQDAAFDADEKFELEYFLSSNAIKYVEEKVWASFSDVQKGKLRAFKAQITKISLDALLRYVYNKYPEKIIKSKIAGKYSH